MKKTYSRLSTLLIAGTLLLSGGAIAIATSNDLLGYSWSDNIGWLDMSASSSPAYAVTLNADGTLTGSAWSDTLGWVSFNRAVTGNPPLNDAATGTPSTAIVNLTTGKVQGWARALAGCAGDMWDATNKVCLGTGPGSDNGVTPTIGSTGSLTFSTSSMVLDNQTNTFDQDIIITNNTSVTLPAVRATIINPSTTYSSPTYSGHNVPITPYYLTTNSNSNCGYQPLNPFVPAYESGIDSSGHYFLQSNFSLSPGKSVDIHAMYYSGCRVIPTVTYVVDSAVKIPEPTLPIGAIQVTTGVAQTSFSTLLGLPVSVTWFNNSINTAYTYPTTDNTYAYQYSDNNGSTWHTAYGFNNGPVFAIANSGSANEFEVVDFGVPQTSSPVTSSRIYKIFTFPSGNYGQMDLGTTSIPKTVSTSNTGWDGWISLSGTLYPSPDLTGNSGITYNPTTGTFTGYAWGSDVVGWLNFNGLTTVNAPVLTPTCTLNALSNSLSSPSQSVTLSWTSTNAASCSLKNTLGGTYSTATTSSGLSITPGISLNFILQCLNGAQMCQANQNVTVAGTGAGGSANGLWLNNDPLKILANATIKTNRSTTLNWDVQNLSNLGYTSCTENVASSNWTGSGWAQGATLPALQAPNNPTATPARTLSGLSIGSHTLSITCTDPTNTLSPVSTTTNSVRITVVPSSINEQ